MPVSPPSALPDLTALLSDLDGSDRHAVDRLLPHVYGELEVLARRHLRDQRTGHTLDTSALVHEAYIRLAERSDGTWTDRSHFFGVAAVAMRHILIDYARKRQAEKRGGGQPLVTFVDGDMPREAKADELIALDEALDRFAKRFERPARVVEMSFFGGLTQEEIAEVLGVSVPTVRRDWTFARAWLNSSLAD
ncbi:MAG: sigma-70 family RNA polymerase sigma factor [Rubricoccaceae bacterium]